jgi:hypothetical protein
MSTQTILAKIHGEHDPHANDPSMLCDTCKVLAMVDRQRDAMNMCLEWLSKSQIDPPTMSRTLLDALR